MRLWEKRVSLAALSVIIGGATCANNREHAASNLQRWYDQDNQRFFAGQLPPVWIHFGALTKYDADGETKSNDNTGFEIIVDRSSSDQRGIVRHEMCHVALRGAEEHGADWQKSMRKFE
jgi:acyl-CoA synthetase (AMP-forming)/AMP-acid ligase II